MIIDPILGIQRKDKIISEREFQFFGIFSTAQMLQSYFENYGYHFIGFFDIEHDLIIVKNNNLEIAILTANYDSYRVINYKTSEVVMDHLDLNEVAQNRQNIRNIRDVSFLLYRIEQEAGKSKVVENATSRVMVEAEEITFLTDRLLLLNISGFEIIFDLETMQSYPLMNVDRNIYVGSNPEGFVDMRTGMYRTFQNTIQPILIHLVDLQELVKKHFYGEKTGNRFRLLDNNFRYGILVETETNTRIRWYDSESERNQILEKIGLAVDSFFPENKVKIKRD